MDGDVFSSAIAVVGAGPGATPRVEAGLWNLRLRLLRSPRTQQQLDNVGDDDNDDDEGVVDALGDDGILEQQEQSLERFGTRLQPTTPDLRHYIRPTFNVCDGATNQW